MKASKKQSKPQARGRSLHPVVGLPNGPFRTIVADPPWEYEGFASDPTSGRGLSDEMREKIQQSDLPYPSMAVAEIAALPVRASADDGCRLFLWTTNRYLREAFDIMAEWGFRYKQTVVWRKTGNPSPFGGSIAPNHAEFLLVGARGAVPVLARLPSNVVDAPAQRRHSAKPLSFLDAVEQVSPGPYLELFARQPRLGWTVWGNEVPCKANNK
jgi:N6-adenosine-specific RNA methylase IME4